MNPSTVIYRGNWTFTVRKDFILHPGVSAGAKCLYLAIRSHCAPDGATAFPSRAMLARALGVGPDTISRYVNELKQLGLLASEQSHEEHGKFSRTIYTLFDTNVLIQDEDKAPELENPPPQLEKPRAENTVTVKPATKSYQEKEELPNRNGDGQAVAPQVAEPSSKPPSPKRGLTDAWCAAYRQQHIVPYVFQGAKDGKAADRLLTCGIPVPKLMEYARAAWRHPDWFWCKQAATLAGFAARVNDIIQELEHPPTTRPRRELREDEVDF